jgi:hypothetical protein
MNKFNYEYDAEITDKIECTDNKQKMLDWVNFIEENGVKQGTPEWLEARGGRVGGSSVSVFMNEYNPFNDKVKFALSALGINKFISDIKPQWGNLFEDVFCKYVEQDKKCEVVGADMFYPDEEGIFAYSPDGLTEIGGEVLLLEFKCPYSRAPDGKIPKYYLPQVLMGLNMIDVANRGLFAEAVFRRCSFIDHAFNNKRDYILHPKTKKADPIPLAIGLIAFYVADIVKCADFIMKLQGCYEDLSPDNDFGIMSEELFRELMHLYDQKAVVVSRGTVMTADNDATYEDMRRFRESAGVIGVLPWKLFRVDYHYVERVPDFLDNIREDAREMVRFVAETKKLSVAQQKYLTYQKYGYKKKLSPCEMIEEEIV